MGAARRRSSLPPLCEACGHANEKRKDAAIGLFALALLFVMAWAARGSASGAGSVNRSRRSLPDGLYDTAAPLALVTSVVPTAAHATASLDASAAGGAAAAAAAAADTAAPSLDGGSGPDGASQGPLELPQPPRPRVYLSWSLRYGLSNQLYSHANGLALALLLGVDGAILPPAVCRRTFNVSLSQLASEDLWAPRPLSTLLDLHRMKEHWRQEHGIQLQEARVLWMGVAAAVRMTSEGAAYPRPLLDSARPQGEPADCAVLPLHVAEFGSLVRVAAAARALVDGARQAVGPNGCIILRTESLFRGFYYNGTAGLQTVAARGMFFNPQARLQGVEALAQRVAESVGGAYNAMHLRFEKDMGLRAEELLPIFIRHMRELGFSRTTPLYAASGLLSYNDTSSLRAYSGYLVESGVGGRVFVKEHVLSEIELEGLHSEQLALLDLLVLARANKLVGTKRSAFSYLARELRLLAGHPAGSVRLHPPQFGGFWQDGLMELAG